MAAGRIDAHQHFWDPARGDYGWLTPDQGPLYRIYSPDDLHVLLESTSVGGTVVVQAAPTEAETWHLLEIARSTLWVLGVVGWLDLESPDLPTRIRAMRARGPLVGVRPMLQDLQDSRWILRPEVAEGLEAIAENGLVFDALITDAQLPVIDELAARFPALPIVIDHAAKPLVTSKLPAEWCESIERLSRHHNVSCKYSGLACPDYQRRDGSILDSYVSTLLNCFGAHRLLWGSDWPVLNLHGDYSEWLHISERILDRLGVDAAACAAIYSENAILIYGLRKAASPA